MHVERHRLGQFFLFIGLILFVLLANSDKVGGAEIAFFCLSMVAFALAFYLIWRDLKTPTESARFRTLRKITQKKSGEKSDKSQAK